MKFNEMFMKFEWKIDEKLMKYWQKFSDVRWISLKIGIDTAEKESIFVYFVFEFTWGSESKVELSRVELSQIGGVLSPGPSARWSAWEFPSLLLSQKV